MVPPPAGCYNSLFCERALFIGKRTKEQDKSMKNEEPASSGIFKRDPE
jgi:hypothetical protein